MNTMARIVKDATMLAVAGTAGYCAYKWMSPSDRHHITREVRRTAEDIGDVGHDVSRMAGTIKDTF